jgi:hypothetical protein
VKTSIAFFLVFALAPSALAAPTKVQCVEADTNGQTLRQSGKLQSAREAFRSCADPACPPLVRADCTTRLDEVARVTPSIVLEARDATGDLADVVVTVDGAPFATRLTGAPVEIDPGSHAFVFTAPNHSAVTRTVIVAEGDKARRVSVTFESAAPSTIAPPTTSSPGAGMRIAGIVIGSIGVVGLGLGAAFGGAAISAWSPVPSECPQNTGCSGSALGQASSSHDTAMALATASDIAFIAGGVLVVTGIAVFFLAPHKRATTALAPWLGPGGGGFVFRSAF